MLVSLLLLFLKPPTSGRSEYIWCFIQKLGEKEWIRKRKENQREPRRRRRQGHLVNSVLLLAVCFIVWRLSSSPMVVLALLCIPIPGVVESWKWMDGRRRPPFRFRSNSNRQHGKDCWDWDYYWANRVKSQANRPANDSTARYKSWFSINYCEHHSLAAQVCRRWECFGWWLDGWPRRNPDSRSTKSIVSICCLNEAPLLVSP